MPLTCFPHRTVRFLLLGPLSASVPTTEPDLRKGRWRQGWREPRRAGRTEVEPLLLFYWQNPLPVSQQNNSPGGLCFQPPSCPFLIWSLNSKYPNLSHLFPTHALLFPVPVTLQAPSWPKSINICTMAWVENVYTYILQRLSQIPPLSGSLLCFLQSAGIAPISQLALYVS